MEEYPSAEPQEAQTEESRSYAALASVLLAIVIIILILLFWRSCGADENAGDDTGGGKVIERVSGLEVVGGGVAVWLKEGTTIEDVLARNGLSGAEVTSLEEGTYVIAIGSRDAAETVVRLKADPGLHDAGFLYSGE